MRNNDVLVKLLYPEERGLWNEEVIEVMEPGQERAMLDSIRE